MSQTLTRGVFAAVLGAAAFAAAPAFAAEAEAPPQQDAGSDGQAARTPIDRMLALS